MNTISPNQHQNCLAYASKSGYRIFAFKDFGLLSKQEKNLNQKITHIEMYYLTNILFMIYESDPLSIAVFDDYNQTIKDKLKFDNKIARIYAREKRLFVLKEKRGLEIIDLQTFNTIATFENIVYFEKICFEIPVIDDIFVGWNVKDKGEIKLLSLHQLPKIIQNEDICLHKNNSCRNFVINRSAKFLASNSKGTIIKVYDLNTKTKKTFQLNMLGREISSMLFIPGETFLVVVEDSGVVSVLNTNQSYDENVEESTGLFQKFTRPKCWMSLNVPLKQSQVAYNASNNSLYFYNPDKVIMQMEVNMKDKISNNGKLIKLDELA